MTRFYMCYLKSIGNYIYCGVLAFVLQCITKEGLYYGNLN